MLLRPLLLCAAPPLAHAQSLGIIIDTDAGSDDILAIAFLLSHPSVHIDAITIANGLAHVDAGARNLTRAGGIAGRPNVPVFAGRPTPLKGSAEFPREWRKTSDDLPGVSPALRLPEALERKRAADYLIEYLQDQKHRVRILALGPLTNLAEALEREPSIAHSIQEIVIMGGAIQVPGNLGDGGVFQTNNKTAEWNIFVDPSGRAHRLPLAHSHFAGPARRHQQGPDRSRIPARVPGPCSFAARPRSRAGLETDRESIQGNTSTLGIRWQPSRCFTPKSSNPAAFTSTFVQDPPQQGRTVQTPGSPNADVAMDADAARFRKIFLEAFRGSRASLRRQRE